MLSRCLRACISVACVDFALPLSSSLHEARLGEQVREGCAEAGVLLGGENALPCFAPGGVNAQGLDRIVYNTKALDPPLQVSPLPATHISPWFLADEIWPLHQSDASSAGSSSSMDLLQKLWAVERLARSHGQGYAIVAEAHCKISKYCQLPICMLKYCAILK